MISDLENDKWEDEPFEYNNKILDNIANPNILYKSFSKCKKEVDWKSSVQKYELNQLSNIVKAHNELITKNYEFSEPYEFIYNERGHQRYIKALTIADRVVQRAFNDNVLNPAISSRIIYDNGASQIGKGISFSRNRFKYHLQSAYRKYGYDGYILIIDFSKYFDNIIHSEILKQYRPLLSDDEYDFIESIFHTFDVDVSYMSDEELLIYKDEIFNMLDYCNIDKKLLTGERFMEKSVGIGNQTSQATGIYYPHYMDNYCKNVKGIHEYGRYMDDSYAIAKTKEELYELLNDIENICKSLGIHINKKKTRIQPLNSNITYLKINYIIEKSGRVVELVPNDIFKREKHRIKSFKNFYDSNKMTFIDILQFYLSWYGSYKRFDSKRKLYAIDCYFRDTFKNEIKDYKNLNELLHDINKDIKKNNNTKFLLY